MTLSYYYSELGDKSYLVMFQIDTRYYLNDFSDNSNIKDKLVMMLRTSLVTDTELQTELHKFIINYKNEFNIIDIEDELITMALL